MALIIKTDKGAAVLVGLRVADLAVDRVAAVVVDAAVAAVVVVDLDRRQRTQGTSIRSPLARRR